jgi:drug/metabolite transporter (DMT)-like permease
MDLGWLHTGEFYSTACGLAWAVAVILFRKSGEHVPPLALNLWKGTVGLALFLVSLVLLGKPFAPPEARLADWLVLMGSGMLGIGIADTLFFAALNRLGAGRLAIVDCLYSPLVLVCSLIYLSEPVGAWLLPGMGLMGAAIVIGAWERAPRGPGQASALRIRQIRTGVMLALASLLFMAVGIVMVKPVLDRSEIWWATTVRLAGGWLLLALQGMLPAHRAAVRAAFRPGRAWRVTLPAAVIGTYVSLILWLLGMKHTTTTTASVLNQLSTIFMLILATLFLKEPLTWRKAIAILAGVSGGVLAAL